MTTIRTKLLANGSDHLRLRRNAVPRVRIKATMGLLRQFVRRPGRETATSTLLYGGLVVTCFWGGALLSVETPTTQNCTLSTQDLYKLSFMPLLLASLASVYVDFMFAGLFEKMLPAPDRLRNTPSAHPINR